MSTTILVGKHASIDGSTLIARNVDTKDPNTPVEFVSIPRNDHQTSSYVSPITGVDISLPKHALGYLMMPNVIEEKDGLYGEAGVNENNVAMTAASRLDTNPEVLAYDPFRPNGLGRDAMLNVVLPYIHSAKEGVEYMGKLIEKYGCAESSGLAFSDSEEVWYMEIATGHHWVAQCIPSDSCAVIANQISQEEIEFTDISGVLSSKGITDFVEKNQLNPDNQGWNFRHIFGTDTERDRLYNSPRVWFAQTYLGIPDEHPSEDDLPLFFRSKRKLKVSDIAYILRSHYNETPYDQLGEGTDQDKGKFRPIAVNKTIESHILQIRSHVRDEAAGIFWLNNGITSFNPYVPFYTDVSQVPQSYTGTNLSFDLSQAHWQSHLVSVLAERSYSDMQPIIEAYLEDCQQHAEQFIYATDVSVKLLKKDEIKSFLEKQNDTIAEHIMSQTIDTIDKLVKAGINVSNLGFERDEHIL